MKINKEKLSKYFLISIGIFIIVAFLYGKFITTPKFQERGRYTVGIFNNYSSTKGGGNYVFFSYSVNEKKFIEKSRASDDDFSKSDVGKRFLVKYVEGEEDLSYLLLKYPVPDSVKSAPLDGWKELPEWAKNK